MATGSFYPGSAAQNRRVGSWGVSDGWVHWLRLKLMGCSSHPPQPPPPKKRSNSYAASIQAVSAQLLESKMERYRWSGIQVKFNCDALGRHKLKALSVSETLESWLATRVWSMNDMAVTGTHRRTHYPQDEIHWDKTASAFNFQPWWRKHVEACNWLAPGQW